MAPPVDSGRGAVAAGIVMLCAGCAPTLDQLVEENAYSREIRAGTRYDHLVVWSRTQHNPDRLHIYIEGDGSPWLDGRYPATDPSPRRPLALELMTRDAVASVYVGRPCYFGLSDGSRCSSNDWTFGRYSPRIVDSMVAVIETILGESDAEHVILFGYSGGGTLARLIAPELPWIDAVVTVAANLDVDAWTSIHGYLPLNESMNPARSDALPETMVHIQLLGDADEVVPREVTDRYLRAGQSAEVWTYRGFDHRCCWVEEWPAILQRIDAQLTPGFAIPE